MNRKIKSGLLTGIFEAIWLISGFSLLSSLHLDLPKFILRTLTGLLGLVILFIGIFYAIKKAKADAAENGITYLTAFKTGVTVSLIVAIIVALSGWFYVTIINPGFAGDMIREAKTSMEQSGVKPDEIARRLESVRKEYSTGGQIFQALVAQSVAGTLFSSILALFFRTKKKTV